MTRGIGHSRLFLTRSQLLCALATWGLPLTLPRSSFISFRLPADVRVCGSMRVHGMRSTYGNVLYRVDMWNSELLKARQNKQKVPKTGASEVQGVTP